VERRWEVVRTATFEGWLQSLDEERRNQIEGAMLRVAAVGPTLGRPRVDSIHRSRLRNLKELRLHGGVRILFAFDPERRAVMLVGGDKTGSWKRWYPHNIPIAERLFADHLRSIGAGSLCLTLTGAERRPWERSR
jgi:hypothetical protein